MCIYRSGMHLSIVASRPCSLVSRRVRACLVCSREQTRYSSPLSRFCTAYNTVYGIAKRHVLFYPLFHVRSLLGQGITALVVMMYSIRSVTTSSLFPMKQTCALPLRRRVAMSKLFLGYRHTWELKLCVGYGKRYSVCKYMVQGTRYPALHEPSGCWRVAAACWYRMGLK